MSFPLGGFVQGMREGQDAQARIREAAQRIQAQQFALDQQKQQIAGAAALFQNLGGLGSLNPQPTGQPPAPGQPSQLSAPPQMAGPGPTQGSSGAPPPGSAPGGVPSAPPMQPGAGSPPASPTGLGGAGSDFSPMGQFQQVMQIAQQIKARNPGITPQQLSYAVEEALGMMGKAGAAGSPELRYLMAQQGWAERGREADQRNDTQRAAIQERYAQFQSNAQAAQSRLQYTQQEIDRRSLSGEGNKAQIAAARDRITALNTELRAAQQQMSSLQSAMVDPSDPRYAQAQARMDKAMRGIDALESALDTGQPAQPGKKPGAPASPAKPKKPVSVPDVTDQASYDAVPMGGQYRYQGQVYTKKSQSQ